MALDEMIYILDIERLLKLSGEIRLEKEKSRSHSNKMWANGILGSQYSVAIT